MKSLMLTTLWKCIGLSIVQIENIKIKKYIKRVKSFERLQQMFSLHVTVFLSCVLKLSWQK